MCSQLCTVAQALWTAFRDFKINNNHDHDILFAVLNVTWSIHSDHDQWSSIMEGGHWPSGVGMIIDREWGINDHPPWSRWSPWKSWWVVEIKNSAIDPPLNFGSLNTVVDRRSDEQGVGEIMAQIEQRIRWRLMVLGGVYVEEKFKNSKRKNHCKYMHFY